VLALNIHFAVIMMILAAIRKEGEVPVMRKTVMARTSLSMPVKIGMVSGLIGLLIGLLSFFFFEPEGQMSLRAERAFFSFIIVCFICHFVSFLIVANEASSGRK